MSKSEAEILREKTKGLLENLDYYIANKNITIPDICDFVTASLKAAIKGEVAPNKFTGSEYEQTFHSLNEFVHLSTAYETALIMIPMQLELLRTENLKVKNFIEYLEEAVAFSLGISLPPRDDEFPHEGNHASDVEERFNEAVDLINLYAERENFQEALEQVDLALNIAAEDPLLIYDHELLLNNRAFYLYKLGRLEEALKDIKEAIDRNAENDLFYFTQAEILLVLNRRRDALESIDTAISLCSTEDKLAFRTQILKQINN